MKSKFLMSMLVLLIMLVGCNSKPEDDQQPEGKTINVISREDGSGTRGAFVELFGIEVKDTDGNKVDQTKESAEITSSTSVMMTTVAGDVDAIGYISLGSLNDTVKSVKIDGVEATIENIKNGTYPIYRPFNIATATEISEETQDFIDFIMSSEGQTVIENKGYIRVEDTGPFSGGKVSGSIVIAGSSSVTPVMEALKEAYETVNPNLTIEIQQSDSTTGMNSVIEGISDIGMASREVKDSELEKGLKPTVIALDGIAVIVNKDNSVNELSIEQVRKIYTGEITEWLEVE